MPTSDVNFSNVSLLLPFDGSNGDVTTLDKSASNHPVTFNNGNVAISTVQSKWGGSSALLSGGYLSVPGGVDLTFNTGDFTVECWVRFNATGYYQGIVSSSIGVFGTDSFLLRLRSAGNLFVIAGNTTGIYGTTPLAVNTWYHVAVVKASNVLYLYVNGVLEGSISSPNSITKPIGFIGNYDPSYGANPLNGYIDDLRITNGIARYTANFTPPIGAYPLSGTITPTPFAGTPLQGALALAGGFASTSTDKWIPAQGNLSIAGAQLVHSFIDTVKVKPGQGALALVGLVPDFHYLNPAQLHLAIVGNVPVFEGRVLAPIPAVWLATRYRCYLTGAENGLPTDAELPISSFQTRINGDSTSYMSCVLKGADNYVDEIVARNLGRLRIWRAYVLSDGTELPFLMVEVLFERIDLSSGGKSGVTGQLSGTGNMIPQTPKTIALKNATFFGLSGGKHRYRCEIDPRLRPGDTATINNTTFIIGGITHIVDTKTTIMEIAEA